MKKSVLLCAVAISLSASMAAAINESEPNDAPGFANPMGTLPATLNGGFPGSFGNGVTDDYWSFSATAGNTYSFVATGGTGIAPLDLGLEISNGSSTLVSQDANGDNAGETINNWAPPSSGTYYLMIYEATGTVNGISGYTVNVSEVASVSDWQLY